MATVFNPQVQLTTLIQTALQKVAPEYADAAILIERPREASHGDWSSNIALQLARSLKQNPRSLAEQLIAALPANTWLAKTEVAGAGFLNFFLQPTTHFQIIPEILRLGDRFGAGEMGGGQPVVVEYVSANPTGPLHVGHARAGAVGEVIATLLEWQGYRVHREFYYNDAGVQIHNLVRSVQARLLEYQVPADPHWRFPEDGYHGAYVKEIADAYRSAFPEDRGGEDLEQIREFAINRLREEQDADLQAFGIRFDRYFLESSLYTDGAVDQTIQQLTENGWAYEQDGALWLKTTAFGDDKDRVMRKSDGNYTYFVPDVAYHANKWQRGFTRAITELGADHHGSLARVRAGLQAMEMGVPQGYPDYVLHQMVTVLRGGEEVKLSKRAGSYITLRELIDEVGRDAVRFFLIMRKHDSQLVFDIDLARSQSEENPVYYVQYAHARICSVLRQAAERYDWQMEDLTQADWSQLTSAYEVALAKRLFEFSGMLKTAAADLTPHLVSFYLRELAGDFHSYYNAEPFLVEDVALRAARLTLIAATAQVIRNGLKIIGVVAPESMER